MDNLTEFLTEFFSKQDSEIVINEAYDALMDAIELLSDEDKKLPYSLIANREYIECFDVLFNMKNITDKQYYLRLLTALRYLYEYKMRENTCF